MASRRRPPHAAVALALQAGRQLSHSWWAASTAGSPGPGPSGQQVRAAYHGGELGGAVASRGGTAAGASRGPHGWPAPQVQHQLGARWPASRPGHRRPSWYCSCCAAAARACSAGTGAAGTAATRVGLACRHTPGHAPGVGGGRHAPCAAGTGGSASALAGHSPEQPSRHRLATGARPSASPWACPWGGGARLPGGRAGWRDRQSSW